jgi:hypothetical protein
MMILPCLHPLLTLAQNRISFSDLQKGMRDQLSGNTNDSHSSYILWGIVGAIVLFGVIPHLRQRKKTGGPPSSPAALFREISREIPFPFGTRLLLQWVARTAQVPAATLLISVKAFRKALEEWSHESTFAPLRQWGAARLYQLHALLFEPTAPAAARDR